jgi:hypothetical protein
VCGLDLDGDDWAVDLTVREWELLELFLSRPGRRSERSIAQQLVNYEDTLSLNTVARVMVSSSAVAPTSLPRCYAQAVSSIVAIAPGGSRDGRADGH